VDHSSIEVNADSRVTIYAAPGCNSCHATEAMLKKLGIEYQRIELGLDPEGREELIRQTGRMGFRQVVTDRQLVGGYQELKALAVEKFTELGATAIANAESRPELAASEARAHRLGRDQAALRRVATLVAKAAKPEEVFSAVAQEVARVFGVELVTVCRYDSEGIVVLKPSGFRRSPQGAAGRSRFPVSPLHLRDRRPGTDR
jgi:glutaredoxin